jgi:arylsulfatase A-like enzyme
MKRSLPLLLSLIAILTLLCAAPRGFAAQNARPNFVFFLVDDLGWMDLGCYGSSYHETPRIDALAKSGVRFTNAYAASPVCSPTRAAIMTGKYPSRVDITDWIPGTSAKNPKLIAPEDRDNLDLNETTLAESFRDKGYQTFYAGKWHLGDEGHFPQDQGFDINKGGHHKGSPPGGYYAPFNNPQLDDKPDDRYLTDRLTDESIEFLDQRDTEDPFLLYFAFYTVHTPVQGNDQYDDYFTEKAKKLTGKAEPIKERGGLTRTRQDNPQYAAMTKSLDDSVGRVLDALEARELDENTVIIFTSDNGGLSTLAKIGPSSQLPLRAGKGWCYEGGIRVPLIIRAPGLSQAGLVSDTPAISMDYFPTMLELAGYDLQPKLHKDGVSLVNALKDKPVGRDTLYWHYPHYHGSTWKPGAAIRVGNWKAINFYEYGETELYDLSNDLGEHNDLSKKNPEKLKELLAKLEQIQKETNAKLPHPNPGYKGI